MADIFNKACQISTTLQCSSLASVMSVTTEPQHDFDVIPKKKLQGTSKIKAAIEILKFTPVNGLELDAMVAIIAQKKYEQLPGPLALKNEIPMLHF